DVADTRVRVDDDLVSETLQPLAIKGLVVCETLAEAPMAIHERQADRRVSVEHLLGRNHLDLDRIDIEPDLVERDPLDGVVDPAQPGVIPIRAGEERGGGFEPQSEGVRHGYPPLQTIRGTPRRSAMGR